VAGCAYRGDIEIGWGIDTFARPDVSFGVEFGQGHREVHVGPAGSWLTPVLTRHLDQLVVSQHLLSLSIEIPQSSLKVLGTRGQRFTLHA
jgi:hypothetical protein